MIPDIFQTQLVAVSASSAGLAKLNDGGRVMLPATVLEAISKLTMVFPLQFKITAFRQKPVYAAVLEFNAEMGTTVLPDWMFQQLQLRHNTPVKVETCNLGEGHIVKLQPHNKAFIQLQDPRLVLEKHLVNYPILFKGACIVIKYAGREFVIDVVDILDKRDRSVDAVLTARADAQATELKVEFDRPLDMPPSPTNEVTQVASPLAGSNVIVGDGSVQFTPFTYKPPSLTSPSTAVPPVETPPASPAFTPFAGGGRRLNDKPAPSHEPKQAMQEKLKAFEGQGRRLR